MSTLILEDGNSGYKYLILHNLGQEYCPFQGYSVLFNKYKALVFPIMIHCEVKIDMSNIDMKQFKDHSLLQYEAKTLERIKHNHVISIISSGIGKMIIVKNFTRIELSKVNFIATELLYDWNGYLNYVFIHESIIRQIFKKICKTSVFIFSKGLTLLNLQIGRASCRERVYVLV